MASTVLNKPYRFILVSDLDWTMVGSQVTLHAICLCSIDIGTKMSYSCAGRPQRQGKHISACVQQALANPICL